MCPRGRAKFKPWTAISIRRKLMDRLEDEASERKANPTALAEEVLEEFLRNLPKSVGEKIHED